jgi:hypothetical protein
VDVCWLEACLHELLDKTSEDLLYCTLESFGRVSYHFSALAPIPFPICYTHKIVDISGPQAPRAKFHLTLSFHGQFPIIHFTQPLLCLCVKDAKISSIKGPEYLHVCLAR